MDVKKSLPKIVLTVSYVFLLIVLLPHTAWMFSILEPNATRELSRFAAIAFEITVAILTHYFSIEIRKHRNIDSLATRIKKQYSNVPAMLLLLVLFASVIANWTHGYIFFAENLDNTMFGGISTRAKIFFSSPGIRITYSILFGAILPICSFAYAYVISIVSFDGYGSEEKDDSDNITDVQRAILAIWELLENNRIESVELITPEMLAEEASVNESIAIRAISSVISMSSPRLSDGRE